MENIPFFTSFDSATGHLTLRGAHYFPEQIFEYRDQIEILDMGRGSLFRLPDQFPLLKKLRIAFFSQNAFEHIPEVLGECENLKLIGFKSCRIEKIGEQALPKCLEWLILTDNRLSALPRSFGALTRLRKLALAGNRLEELPDAMAECQALELIRIGANKFGRPPAPWLFQLPLLAWFCDSGNPFSADSTPDRLLANIAFERITYQEQIGKSPTSTVFKGKDSVSGEQVAIKHYLGELTSDGFADDDIRAYAIAGLHPSLVSARGKLVGHPESIKGLVLDLIPESYSSLGNPPDFISCTRDTFPSQRKFTSHFIWQALRDIAAALTHLHSRNLTHGDLYAHNILSDMSGKSVLGDFGAASSTAFGAREERERIDVRAFGYLMDDLLIRADGDVRGCDALDVLRKRCLDSAISDRPLMHEVSSTINSVFP